MEERGNRSIHRLSETVMIWAKSKGNVSRAGEGEDINQERKRDRRKRQHGKWRYRENSKGSQLVHLIEGASGVL